MKRWVALMLWVVAVSAVLLGSGQTANGQAPPESGVYFERCEELRGNATERDRCIGDELNKQRAIETKHDELNLDRCSEFLIPYHRLHYEACVGEEFNKFPELGPEVEEQYLAGAPWIWPEDEPAWWDDYYPVTTPAAEEGAYRWWEDGFYVTPQPTVSAGTALGDWYKQWPGNLPLDGGSWGAPPEW